MSDEIYDLLVVGAGPTGIAIGAEAKKAGLNALLVDRGALCNAILGFPTGMLFFTTRDKLEIADVPFGIPEEKPSRRQALAYYQGVVRRYGLSLALHEEVLRVERTAEGEFRVETRRLDAQGRPLGGNEGGPHWRRARAVAFATGYFFNPRRLGVPGDDLPWVHYRYMEPYPHYGEHVVVVGGGNSACEAALDLWRNNVRVTLVHRRAAIKPTVKYWLKPDFENRVEEGSIAALYGAEVEELKGEARGTVVVRLASGERRELRADAVYALLGYLPDAELLRRSGVRVDEETLVPDHDGETCESNVGGLYVAGTLQAGRDTGRIFIENSRAHAPLIVGHLLRRGGTLAV